MSRPTIALLSALPLIDGAQDDVIPALLPLCGRPLLWHQAQAAQLLGVTHLYIVAEGAFAPLNRLVDEIGTLGMEAMLIFRPSDLPDHVPAHESLLVIAAGCDAAPDLLDRLASREAGGIAVLDAAAHDDRYERIDLGYRWAGAAVLSGRTAHQIADLPGDWDLLSALLRQAVQNDVPFVPVREAECPRYTDTADMDDAALDRMDGVAAESGSAFAQWITAPLARMTLPSLWDNAPVLHALPWAAVGVAALAAFTAYGASYLWAALLVLISVLIGGIGAMARQCQSAAVPTISLASAPASVLHPLLIMLTALIAGLQGSMGAMVEGGMIAFVAVALLWLARYWHGDDALTATMTDPGTAAAAMLAMGIIGCNVRFAFLLFMSALIGWLLWLTLHQPGESGVNAMFTEED